MKRYLIEFGMGTDIHGQSVTNAAKKAVKDAISHSCMCGLEEVLGYTYEQINEKMVLKVTVAVSNPEGVDTRELEKILPIGKKEFTVISGGMKISGVSVAALGDKDDSIEIALVCIEVFI